MTLDDFHRLKKLMALTISDFDPEALLALRAANAILIKYELTWERVLSRSVKIEMPFEEV